MQTKIIATILAIGFAAPASAFGLGGDTNTNIQGQTQGQVQGQGQLQGQTQNANNSNSINVEGSVSASVGAAACTNGFGIGLPGVGAISFSASDKNCAIVREAQTLQAMGYTDLAISHMTQIDRVANTVRAVQGAATTTSTRSEEAVLYRSCAMENGRAVVRVSSGLSDAEIATARAQCAARLQ